MLPLPEESGALLTEPVLYWCVKGSLLLDVDGDEHRVDEGMASWVPVGRRVRTHLRHRDVAVPLPGLAFGSSSEPVRMEIPESWGHWLLHSFSEALGYLDGASTRARVQSMLDEASTASAAMRVPYPRGPISADLQPLSRAIIDHPAMPVREHVVQRMPGWSQRTLQRRFTAETGLTPEQWARRHRNALAAELLSDGADVATTAYRVGYATPGGFSRRFHELTGVTPARWRTDGEAGHGVIRPGEAPSAQVLPAQRTWSRVNGSHVAVWVGAGSAAVTVGATEVFLEEGDAIVLPAGVPNSIRMSQGSLVLPVGYRSGRSAPVGRPDEPARMGGAGRDGLIQAMVSAYTSVRPPASDVFAGFDRVLAASRPQQAEGADAKLAALASALACGELPDPTVEQCARWSGCSERELSGLVNDRAGITFAQWVRMSRMSRARSQLNGGDPAATVSRRLGYAHVSAFSRAFREVHGKTPQTVAVPAQRTGEAGRWRRDVVRRLALA